MERFSITLPSYDMEKFEYGRASMGMTKSAYIRYLIAEHENKVPYFLQYRDIILILSELDSDIKRLILSEKILEKDKLKLYEKMKDIRQEIRNGMK